MTIDADAFKTADGDLESSLKMICDKVHAYGDVPTYEPNPPAVVNFAPEPGSVEVRPLELAPQIGDDDVLVEVAAVGSLRK